MKKHDRISSLFKKYNDIIIGKTGQLTTDQRLILMICVIMVAASLAFIIPGLISHANIIGIILNILVFVIACIYYYLIRFKKKNEKNIWHLILLTQILVSIIFFFTSGSKGTNNYAFLILVVFILLLPKRKLLFVLLLANIVFLMVIEYINPDLIVYYTDPRSRFYDHLLAIIITSVILFLTIDFFRKAHETEKKKNLAQNKELEIQKKQLLLLSEQERKINEIKTNYFTNISHEFTIPLTLIKSPVEKLLSIDTDEKRKEHYYIILENMEKLNNLVDQILDFRKVGAGKTIPELKEHDMGFFLQKIYRSFAPMCEMYGINLIFNDLSAPLKMMIDPVKTEKILNNIISNAFKFSPCGSKIEVVAKKVCKKAYDEKTSVLRISVKDYGKGIPVEYQNDIFSPFFQLPGTEHGTGLGLAIAKEYVESMNGKIYLDSVSGEGSQFFIDLPIVQNIDQFNSKPVKPNSYNVVESNYGLKPKFKIGDHSFNTIYNKHTLLIVENNNDVVSYLKDGLSDEYFILSSNNGKEALETISKTIPDLVISDVTMPEMDGIKLCKKIKLEHAICHVPVIMLTTKEDNENITEGLKWGADDYISKPFEMGELKTKVKNIIDKRELLRQHCSKELYTIAPDFLAFNTIDKDFLKRAVEIVKNNMTNQDFGPTKFVEKLEMSRSSVFLKLKKLTGRSPSQFMASIRINVAANLLKDKKLNISEVAYQVGFNDPTYFNRLFKKTFQKTPSEYRKL